MARNKHCVHDKQLARLIYRSRSLLPWASEQGPPALAALLEAARHNNILSGITGVLVFDGATFLQAMEGPMRQVEQVYEDIACDQRHEHIELIALTAIDGRDYSAWSMAYLDGSATQHGAVRRFLSREFDTSTIGLGKTVTEALKAMLLETAQP